MAAPRSSLPPLAWAALFGAGLLLVVMVVLLVAQLAVLRDSQQHIESQDAKITALSRTAGPLLEESRPLADEARRLARPIRSAGGDVAAAAEALPEVERATRALAGEGVPLLQALNGTDLPSVVRGVGFLTAAALDEGRLPRVLDATNRALATLEGQDALRTIPRDLRVVPRLERLQRRTLRVQIRTLRSQRRSLDTLLRSLTIQRETLERARSIDRKTGPAPPATPVSP